MNTPPPLSPAERALCAAQAAWLRAVLQLAPLAWWLQLATLLIWLHRLNQNPLGGWLPAALGALGALGVLAVLERVHALRLAFDARLFEQLAAGQIATLDELDTALHGLGLRAHPAAAAPLRPLSDRLRGCRRLVWRYVACVGTLGALCVIAALAIALA